MENNWICEVTREITYCSNQYCSDASSVELRFDAEDVDRIARVMILVKENNLSEARIDCGSYVVLNEEGEESDFTPDIARLIIYEDGITFFAQDEDCDQIESESMTWDEINKLDKIAD